jgi:hypothetical protein
MTRIYLMNDVYTRFSLLFECMNSLFFLKIVLDISVSKKILCVLHFALVYTHHAALSGQERKLMTRHKNIPLLCNEMKLN